MPNAPGDEMPRHVCGLQGFGRGLDGLHDTCPACDERATRTPATDSPAETRGTELEDRTIEEYWTKLLDATQGVPNGSDILGIVHVLRANEFRRGRIAAALSVPVQGEP